MGRWTDLAEWRGPTVNQGGPMVEQRGLVVHIAEGTYEGTIAWQKNRTASVSSHFVVANDGRIAQVVDTATTAWTQRVGNGHWVSVENEGHSTSPLTDAQVEANARILARGHREHGWLLQLATAPSGRGLGHHSMGAENGVDWGHSACPGPLIKAQKPLILARAIAIVKGVTPPPQQEEDMPPVFVWCEGLGLCLVDGGLVLAIKSTAGWKKIFDQRGWDWKLIQGGREVQVTREELDSMGVVVNAAAFAARGGQPVQYAIELSGATGTATAVAAP